jgi:hypothetical protein
MRKFRLSVHFMTLLLVMWIPVKLAGENRGNNPSPIQAIQPERPIRIDGLLDEEVWQTEGYSGFRQSDPQDGAPESEKTVVWVAYDRNSLYVASRLYDSSPEGIVSRLGRRDADVESDWFVFAIDPYFDRRSGFLFAVNPAGSIMDGTLFNDEGKDLSWDGIWKCAARIDEKGWAVEIRIPYHQLHFKQKDSYTWGVNFFRTIKRKNEQSVYAWIPKEESGYVSRFVALNGIHDIHPGRVVELLPYTAGRAHYSPAIPNDPFRTGASYEGNAGFDLKSSLQTYLTLNLTVNPDFGQVEVDPAVINISDQETYYLEKRPFFVEGADIFRFGYGGANTVQGLGWNEPSFFYSRRIGRSPQGYITSPGFVDSPDWTTILGAAKITGKVGDGWNIGVLTALTQREYASFARAEERFSLEIEPFTSYNVLRVQKEFNSGFQGLGFIATGIRRNLRTLMLEDTLPRSALGYGLDGWTFLDRDRTWVVTGWIGGTRIWGKDTAITGIQMSSLHYYQRPDADYVQLDPAATSLSGWAGRIYLNKQNGPFVFNTSIGAMSPGFHAVDMGYHTRGDIINGHIEAGYQSFHPGKLFRNWKVTLTTCRSYDFGGTRTDENYVLDAKAQFLNYWSTGVYLSYDPNRYSHWLTRGGPLARYPWGFSRQLSISSDNRRPIVVTLSGHYRTHPYGSYNYSLGGSIRWKPNSNLSLSLGPGYSWRHSVGQYITQVIDPLKTETYGVRYILSDVIQETASLEVRLNWIFTPRLSLQAYIQPFIGVGDFFKYKELHAVRTFDFDVFGDAPSTIERSGAEYKVDPDGPGPSPAFSFRDPDFNLKSLRGTIVLRWEYHPGSTVYVVWTQNRADYSYPGDFDFDRDFSLLFRARGDNIFLFKINYRFIL